MSIKRIKDRIDGNEIDCSLSELTEVPEKELAMYPKVNVIDLSRNHLSMLSPTFSKLTHIIKLDLSKNNLVELPSNFGELTKLESLDLYGNNLTMLPVSFCQLKRLKWLDLKDNPLDKQLSTVAGDCLDEKQCQNCSKNVVSFMQSIYNQLEIKRLKKWKEEQALQKKLKAAEEKQKERIKQEKKLAKEKRRNEHLAKKKLLEEVVPKNQVKSNVTGIDNHNKASSKNISRNSKRSSILPSFISMVLNVLLLIFLCVVSYILFEHYNQKKSFDYESLHFTFHQYYLVMIDKFNIYCDIMRIYISNYYKISRDYLNEIMSKM